MQAGLAVFQGQKLSSLTSAEEHLGESLLSRFFLRLAACKLL